jgi:hypothetical protein
VNSETGLDAMIPARLRQLSPSYEPALRRYLAYSKWASDMDDERYRNLAFAPWATGVGARREITARLQLLERAVCNCQDREPDDEERDAFQCLASRDDKLAGFCRPLEAALALPYPGQRSVDAKGALEKITKWLIPSEQF